MARNQLFESASAHGLALLGDVAEASKWINYARAQLGGLIARQVGATTLILKPTADVEVQIFTRPNRIIINAGSTLKLLIHGYLYYTPHSEFAVYDGSNPTKFTNPIPLVPDIVAAVSPKWNKTYDRPTFPRYKELSNGDYACFGGYADLYNRIYKADVVPGGHGGEIFYKNKIASVGGICVMDVALINGAVYALYYFATTSADKSVVLTKVDVPKNSTLDICRFRISRSAGADGKYGFTITAEKYFIQDVQDAQIVTLVSKTPTDIGKPVGAHSRQFGRVPIPEILDARFSVDGSKVCILAGLINDTWRMEPEIGPFSPSDPGGGEKEYSSVADIVVLPFAAWVNPAAELADPFTQVDAVNPIGYAFYKHESITVSEKFETTVLTHNTISDAHFNGSYTYPQFECRAGTILLYSGASVCAVYNNYDGTVIIYDEANKNSLFNEHVIPAGLPPGVVTFTWNGDASIQWQTSDIPTNVEAYHSVIGSITRNYTVVVDFNWFGRGDLGIVTTTSSVSYACGRVAEYSSALRVDGTRTITRKGAVKVGYSIDTDKKSLAYGSRKFVEMGYKIELSGDINRSETISVAVSIDNQEKHRVGTTMGIPEITSGISNVRESTTQLTVTNGGNFAVSLYVDDTVISRVYDLEGIPSNYSYYRHSSTDLDWVVNQFVYVDKVLDVSTTCPENPAFLTMGDADTKALRFLPISYLYSGSVDFDKKIGIYYLYSDASSSGNFPKGQYTPTNKAVNWPYFTTLSLSGRCKKAHTLHAVASDAGELEFNRIEEIGAQLPAVDLSNAEYSSYFSSNVATYRGNPQTSGYQIFLPYYLLGYIAIPENRSYFEAPAEWVNYTDIIGKTPYTIHDFRRPYHGLPSQAYKVITKDVNGNDIVNLVAIYTSEDGGISNDVTGDFPTKKDQFSRAGIAVLDTLGAKLADTRIFPDGTNPSANLTEYWLKVIGGFSLIE